MGGIPSKPDPSRTMEVISTGYSKTGTVTMQHALERLTAGPVIHGGTHALANDNATMYKWLEAWRAKKAGDRERCKKILKEVTAGYTSCTDMPPCAMLPELVEIYPNAKVIIVTRDPDRWWASMEEHLTKVLPWWGPFLMPLAARGRWFPDFANIWLEDVDELVGGRDKWGPQIMIKHNEMCRTLVPKDRQLEYSLDQGWEPLAKFLGVPVPENEPFPKVNEAAEGTKVATRMLGEVLVRWACLLSAVGGGLYAGLRYYSEVY